MAIFREGQRLEVTDNTGKPSNTVQTIQVLSLERTDEPEYFVYIENPDPEEIAEHGEFAYNALWQLDKAVLEHRIFVRILD